MAFHWRDGWYFSRLPDGSVEVRNHGGFDGGAPELAAGDGRVALVIPADEWASIVCSVSKEGEANERWDEAREFHSGCAAQIVHTNVARSKRTGSYMRVGAETGFGRRLEFVDDILSAERGTEAGLMHWLGGHARGFEQVPITIRTRANLGDAKPLPDPDEYYG